MSGFVPGALAGTQLAGLLFFLNPQLPFDPLPVFRGVLAYGTLLGAISLLATLPFIWGRAGKALRWLPVGLTLVLAAAGVSAWIHASRLAFYLPPGINSRLLKAAIWLSVAALISFYSVQLHRLRGRRYGWRSWTVFALMALASVYVVMERREAFRPRVEPAPATTLESGTRPLLFVVGIESATFDAILPLEQRGRLPFFSRLLREGAHARLSSLFPARRSPQWATFASGKYPYQHGVVGERTFAADLLAPGTHLSLLPLGMGFEHWGIPTPGRAIDATTARARPLWEILARLGMSAGTVAWPLTHPCGSGLRTCIPERFFSADSGVAVVPPELAERARLFRTRPPDLDPAVASRFGPQPPQPVLAALARDLWIRDLALFLLDQEPPLEAFFLALPGLDSISRQYFGAFSAVQFEGVRDRQSEEAAQLVEAYYVHLDEQLSQLWNASRRPLLLVVASTHGVEGAFGRHEVWRRLRGRPSRRGYVDRSPDGVLMVLGDGVKPGALLRSAQLVDVVPTLLYGLGLPSARDFDGAILIDAFETAFLARQPLTFVPSYETFAPREDESGSDLSPWPPASG